MLTFRDSVTKFSTFLAQNIYVETKKFAKPFLHVCMGQKVEFFKAKKIFKNLVTRSL